MWLFIELLSNNATYLIMTGNSLELKIRLINWKLLIIGRVMTSLIVITLEIGQSAGKEPNFDMLFSLNDRTGMGLKGLGTFNDSLRYSLSPLRNFGVANDSAGPTASYFRW